jgi:hypothetical protein
MWPFGPKATCFQCDRQVRGGTALKRRGFLFCSSSCAELFVATQKLPRPPGDIGQLRKALGGLLVAASGELARAGAAAHVAGGVTTRSGLFFAMPAEPSYEEDELLDAMARFHGFVVEALPYLAALGLDSAVAAFDAIHLEGLVQWARTGNVMQLGHLQQMVVSILHQI